MRWVKYPNPGQFRGDGDWIPFTGTEDEWEYLLTTNYLPVKDQDEKPSDDDEGEDAHDLSDTLEDNYVGY